MSTVPARDAIATSMNNLRLETYRRQVTWGDIRLAADAARTPL